MKFDLHIIVILVLSVLSVHSKKSRDKQRDSSSSKTRSKTIDDVINDVCMPKRTDRLVYRYRNDTHIYVGFDVLSECTVYSMTWRINEGNNEYLLDRGHAQYDQRPSGQVRRTLQKDHILATAGPRQQQLFREFSEECQDSITSTSCLMEALARTALKMRKLRFERSCDTGRPPACSDTTHKNKGARRHLGRQS